MRMDIKRSVTILLPDDSDLRATVAAFQGVQHSLVEAAYNGGKPLSAISLHHVRDSQVAVTLSSQITRSAICLTAAAYCSAQIKRRNIDRSFAFPITPTVFLPCNRCRVR